MKKKQKQVFEVQRVLDVVAVGRFLVIKFVFSSCDLDSTKNPLKLAMTRSIKNTRYQL